MAVSQSQIVDLLYKQAFGVTKTDTAVNKSPSNESIPSPLLIRGDTLWSESNQIPNTAAAVSGIVQAYTGVTAVQTTADITTVPIGGIYPTWKTGLTYWIPPEFGATYTAQIWVDNPGAANPTLTGTQIFAAGSGGTGQYYFNYQSGVLNFIGETIPAPLTSGKVLYVVGYRYVGKIGVTNLGSNTTIGNLSFIDTTISSLNSDPVEIHNGLVVVGNFNANTSANISLGSVSNIHIDGGTSGYVLTTDGLGNLSWAAGGGGGNSSPGGNTTQIQFNNAGVFDGSANLTFDTGTNVLTLAGSLIADSIQLGTGSNNVATSYGLTAFTINTVPNQPLYSLPVTGVSGVDFNIIATDNTANIRQSVKLASVLLGSEVQFNEYSGLYINGDVGNFQVAYVAGSPNTIQLLVSPKAANPVTYKLSVTVYAD
jgi:hypothetical protein